MIAEQYPTSGPIRIVIRHRVGPVELTASATETVEVRVDGPDADDYTVDFSAGILTVKAPPMADRWLRPRDVAVTIAAPEGSQLDVESGAGSVNVHGAFGSSTLHTGAGNIAIDQVCADTTLETGAGRVRLGTVSAKTKLHLGAGNTDVDELSGDLTVASGAGALNVARALRGTLSFESAAGNVTIGVPAGTPTWTKLHTLMGHVDSSLPPVGEPPEGADHLELRIQTVTGNIALQPA